MPEGLQIPGAPEQSIPQEQIVNKYVAAFRSFAQESQGLLDASVGVGNSEKVLERLREILSLNDLTSIKRVLNILEKKDQWNGRSLE